MSPKWDRCSAALTFLSPSPHLPLTFPTIACSTPSRETRNSARPARASLTARATSLVSVPSCAGAGRLRGVGAEWQPQGQPASGGRPGRRGSQAAGAGGPARGIRAEEQQAGSD